MIQLVTGGAGTLALQGARALLEHGLRGMALFDINPQSDHPSISSLRADYPRARILLKQVDVTNDEKVNQAVHEVATELGSINILCCYAGVVGCVHALDISAEEWRRTLEINTTGAFLCAQAVAKYVSYWQISRVLISKIEKWLIKSPVAQSFSLHVSISRYLNDQPRPGFI